MTDPTQVFEEWKPVAGWGDRYQVSSLGRVRSLYREKRMAGRDASETIVLTPHPMRKGRLGLGLCFEGTSRAVHVHRLVLEAFVGPRGPGQQASHLDGNPLNNAASNLVWESCLKNNHRKIEHGTLPLGSRVHSAKLDEARAVTLVAYVRGGATFDDAARAFGICHSTVWGVMSGKTWSHVTGIEKRVFPRSRKHAARAIAALEREAGEGT